MGIKLYYYIPEVFAGTEEVKKVENLLEKIELDHNIQIAKKIINENDEGRLKSDILWGLSVTKRIGIRQTRRTKSLYSQLVIFSDGEPITFYPQKYGAHEITIIDFLKGLIKGDIKVLHDKHDIQEKINATRK